MFALTANKYLAFPKTGWLQLGKAVQFLYKGAVISHLPSQGFPSERVFTLLAARLSPAGRAAQPPMSHYSLGKKKKKKMLLSVCLPFWCTPGVIHIIGCRTSSSYSTPAVLQHLVSSGPGPSPSQAQLSFHFHCRRLQ